MAGVQPQGAHLDNTEDNMVSQLAGAAMRHHARAQPLAEQLSPLQLSGMNDK